MATNTSTRAAPAKKKGSLLILMLVTPVALLLLPTTLVLAPAMIPTIVARIVDPGPGRHLTINATGAIAALLLEIGLPAEGLRGIAVVSRAGGLVGHLLEERETHAGRAFWEMIERETPYEDPIG